MVCCVLTYLFCVNWQVFCLFVCFFGRFFTDALKRSPIFITEIWSPYPTYLKNFRPISKLSYLSNVLEKTVLSELSSFMNQNNLFDKFQSGFRAHHSTESALLKVTNDLLLTTDTGDCAILILLDLSSAFDTVDHSI